MLQSAMYLSFLLLSEQHCCELCVIAVIEGVSSFDYIFFINKLALKA